MAICATEAAAAPPEIIGQWESSFGLMTLRESSGTDKEGKGKEISGFWIQDRGKRGVIRSGKFFPKTRKLEFSYFQDWNKQSGQGNFELSEDGKTLTGKWSQANGSGDWIMERIVGSNLSEQIDSIVDNYGVKPNEPGIAILVVKSGETIFSKCYGMANVDENRKLTADTPMELASISKVFTSVLALQLYEEGKLNLNDDIRLFVPELPVYSVDNPIRISDLLHHTSGLPSYMSFQYPKKAGAKFVGLEDYAGEFANQKNKFPLAFPTGSKFEYNNSNYMLLALIIQRIRERSFGTVLREKIFDPLGMEDCWVNESPDSPPKHAIHGYHSCLGYSNTGSVFKPNRILTPKGNEQLLTCGDGFVWCSLNSIAKFDEGITKNKLITSKTLRLALVPSRTNDGRTNNYGYGLFLGFNEGKLRTFGHNGVNRGVRTSYYHDSIGNHSIAVLCNRANIESDKVWNSIDRLVRANYFKR